MHQPRRRPLLVAAAVMVCALVIDASAPQPARALTSTVWMEREPNGQRFLSSALSADGTKGYMAGSLIKTNSVDLDWTAAKIWRTTDSGMTWSTSGNIPAGSWDSVATTSNGTIVVGTGKVGNNDPRVVVVSTNSGDTWTTVAAPSGAKESIDITADGSVIAIATSNGVYTSTDNGTTWAPSSITSNVAKVTVGKNGTTVVINAIFEKWAYSWQTGATSVTSSELDTTGGLFSLDASDNGSVVIVGGKPWQQNGKSYVSTNSGTTWTTTDHNITLPINAVAVKRDGTKVGAMSYAATSGYLYESTDNGATWQTSAAGSRTWLTLSYSNNANHAIAGIESVYSSDPGVLIQTATPAPTISEVLDRDTWWTPEVPINGGTRIWISGRYFYDVTGVTIGGAPATSFSVPSVTGIEATAPPGVAGSADVVVTTHHGSTTYADAVTYYTPAAPTVVTQSRKTGSRFGHEEFSVSGAHLHDVTEVTVGGRTSTFFVARPLPSNSSLYITLPPVMRVGKMSISITNPQGTTVLTDAWTSTWEASTTDSVALSATSLSSTEVGSTITVTVNGTGFTERTDASIAGRPVDGLQIISDSELRFTTTRASVDRTVEIFGDINVGTVTMPAYVPPAPAKQEQTPAKEVPKVETLKQLPKETIAPTTRPFTPGAPVTVAVGGFVGGEEVWFIVASTPRRIGSAFAAADGTVSSKVTLPSNLVGQHTLIAWSPSTGRGVRQPITISMTLKMKRAVTASTLLKKHSIAIPKKSSLKLSSQTPKTCRATSPTRLTARTKGTCRVAIVITPQKGKASTKRLSIIVN